MIDSVRAASWLVDHADVEMQAVGLLLQQVETLSADGTLEASGEGPDLDRIGRILDSTSSPAVIAMLASVCAASDQIERCRSLGVEQAIIDHDEGNILHRTAFLGDDRTVWQEAILSHPVAHHRLFEITGLVHQALLAYAASEPIDYADSVIGVQASMFTSSVAMPFFGSLLETCRDGDADLLAGCRHVAQAMMTDSPSLISSFVGLSLMQVLAVENDDARSVTRWKDSEKALRTYVTCLSRDVPMEYHEDMTSEEYQQWLSISASRGELAGMEHWASENGIDCSTERQALTFRSRHSE